MTDHEYHTYSPYMRQLHFSVEEETAKRLTTEARRRGMSLSRYLATLVSDSVDSKWPKGYLQRVIGSCSGSDLEEPADTAPEDVVL